MIHADDVKLLQFASTAEDIWARLLQGGLKPGESIE